MAIALLAAVLALCLFPGGARAALTGWTEDVYTQGWTATTSDGWDYDVNANTGTAAIVGYQGAGSTVTVPLRVDGYDVEVILSLGGGLTDIVIPDGVKGLGGMLFAECPNLRSVTVPASVVDIDRWTFMDSPAGLAVYGYSGTAAETAAKAQEVIFVSIDRSETIDRGTTPDGYEYVVQNGEAVITGYSGSGTVLSLPARAGNCPVTAVGRAAFCRRIDLTGVTVPEGVVSIGDYAFFNCTGLTQLSLPGSLRRIGDSGLSCCDALTSLVLPEGLVRLDDNALAQCNSLTSVTVPGTLREAGAGAFSWVPCASLSLPEGMSVIADWLFFDTPITRFIVPGSVTEIREDAFVFCSSLTQVVIPATVTTIHDRAFRDDSFNYSAENLTICGYRGSAAEQHAVRNGIRFAALDEPATRLTLPKNLKTLDRQALAGTAAEAVYVPAGCASIAGKAFENCSSLRALHVAGSATVIASDAFDGCAQPVIIYAPAGSAARSFAEANGMPWIEE